MGNTTIATAIAITTTNKHLCHCHCLLDINVQGIQNIEKMVMVNMMLCPKYIFFSLLSLAELQ